MDWTRKKGFVRRGLWEEIAFPSSLDYKGVVQAAEKHLPAAEFSRGGKPFLARMSGSRVQNTQSNFLMVLVFLGPLVFTSNTRF